MKKSAFTTVELLVAMVIIIVISGLGLQAYIQLRNQSAITGAANDLVDKLGILKSYAQNNVIVSYASNTNVPPAYLMEFSGYSFSGQACTTLSNGIPINIATECYSIGESAESAIKKSSQYSEVKIVTNNSQAGFKNCKDIAFISLNSTIFTLINSDTVFSSAACCINVSIDSTQLDYLVYVDPQSKIIKTLNPDEISTHCY